MACLEDPPRNQKSSEVPLNDTSTMEFIIIVKNIFNGNNDDVDDDEERWENYDNH